ncbi:MULTISPECIES: malate dehydrogenase (quinone) [Comamonas]|uniref:malate dehydrogenase (quinone) n=1 Tax=Comamonas TaxID=283 RepID=UPI00051031EE|nr:MULTISPECIES: malate dehydrogenase (quinone) [Comamonas]KGG93890.1 malate:quinone oxidoreductase [Comamonas thiooxydans]KGG99854.1 malate:quinone oxidoreductase [Comamonas thiooxydans]KGH06248.1 malate:quinone oxidoreductase [Comamonas thiooxydans]KGH14652.1 malate:quinone oxidoreductase [Comamonas thiooxydans]TZG08511.1 malate dehydrogenase (quinone) [Comamonas thiooxydans]
MKKSIKAGLGAVAALVLAALLFLFWPIFPRSVPKAENEQPVDVVMVGAGVMSTTLATYLQELQPDWKIEVFERLDGVALESSNGWNNAGTGHSGFAELNYTPQLPDGSVETKRAVSIAEQFEVTRQFWAHQVGRGHLQSPETFVNATPHMSFVWGDDNIAFLKKRQQALVQNPLFYGMEYSEDQAQIKKWAPLMIEGRDPAQKIAATYMPLGTDVNHGVWTEQLMASLQKSPNFQLHLQSEVTALRQNTDKTWNVTVADLAKGGQEKTVKAKFVFVGAGGAALKLLQASGIPESKNYAGFPVGGQFLAIENPELAKRHDVKAYGIASTGSPPMSVPHLDARQLDGKPVVLFGPFALATTKFLKNGSWWDLFSSVTHDNLMGMLRVGIHNLDLVQYLMQQAELTDADRQAILAQYFPEAKREDWKLVTAGQRVQIIKRDPEKGAVLQFGTEIVGSEDGSIAALLGASPGASTAPHIMLNLLKKSFPEQMASTGWKTQIQQIVPSYGRKINEDAAYTNEIRRMTSSALKLPYVDVPADLGKKAEAAPAPAAAPQNPTQLNKEMQAL